MWMGLGVGQPAGGWSWILKVWGAGSGCELSLGMHSDIALLVAGGKFCDLPISCNWFD